MSPPARRLLAIRHAPTTWNAQKRIQGHADPPLSAEGAAMARAWRLPAGFACAQRWVSPLQRARATAAAMGLEAHRIEPRLIEADWGAATGQTLAALRADPDFRSRERRFLDFRPEGGESPRETRARVGALLREVADDTVWITHKGVLLALIGLAFAWPYRGKPPLRLARDQAPVFLIGEHGVLYLRSEALGR